MDNKPSIEYVTKEILQLLIKDSEADVDSLMDDFLLSKTYELICNQDYDIWRMPPYALHEIYMAEKQSGDPLKSIYIGGDI